MELLVWIGVVGCGCPIYTRVLCSGTIYFALINIPPSSASDYYDSTSLMTWEIFIIYPLFSGKLVSRENKIWPTTPLRGFGLLS